MVGPSTPLVFRVPQFVALDEEDDESSIASPSVARRYDMEIANRIVLLEPEWEEIKEVQAIGRVNRIRPPHEKTFCYRIYAENSPIVSGIIERRQRNKTLSDLVLSEYEGLLRRPRHGPLSSFRPRMPFSNALAPFPACRISFPPLFSHT